jgi:glycosyltransferase involved in cell wall biosynthesis
VTEHPNPNKERTSVLQEQPFVSVVTPVYNGERYLAECIESVLGQTHVAWEYIIVNNCSTDRTLEIAQSYARRDSRIRIHNNETFVGVIQNHNIGFRLISAQSKYCKVLQADDWLFSDCLARMVEVAEANPSVGIVGAYRLDGSRVNLDGLPYPSTVVSGRQICRLTMLGTLYVFGSPTSLLFRSDLIRDRKEFFDQSSFSVHVDAGACYDVLQDADFGFVHQVLTFTRRHGEAETSLSRRNNSYLAAKLIWLIKYGPVYLDRAEYKQCLEELLNRYYRFLGECVFQRRDKQFWDYHRNALKTLGHPLNSTRLLKQSCLEAMDLLLHPVDVFRKAVRLIWKRSVA